MGMRRVCQHVTCRIILAASLLRKWIRGDEKMNTATTMANGQSESCATTACGTWIPEVEQNPRKIMVHGKIAAFIQRYQHNWILKAAWAHNAGPTSRELRRQEGLMSQPTLCPETRRQDASSSPPACGRPSVVALLASRPRLVTPLVATLAT